MCGQVAMVFSSVCTPPLRNYYSPKLRAWTGVICGTMLLLNLALLVFYPIALEDARIWMLFGIILLFFLRKMLGRRFIRRCFRREKLEKRFAAMYAMLYLLSILVAAALLLPFISPIPGGTRLLGGFVLVSAMEAYSQLRGPCRTIRTYGAHAPGGIYQPAQHIGQGQCLYQLPIPIHLHSDCFWKLRWS